jgi:hypothetical protein
MTARSLPKKGIILGLHHRTGNFWSWDFAMLLFRADPKCSDLSVSPHEHDDSFSLLKRPHSTSLLTTRVLVLKLIYSYLTFNMLSRRLSEGFRGSWGGHCTNKHNNTGSLWSSASSYVLPGVKVIKDPLQRLLRHV